MSIEQSRRDDLEALFYILIYIIKGKLPWQGLAHIDDETRIRRISEMKCSITPDKLAEGLSPKFATFMKYVKKLKFADTPDYAYLSKLLREIAEEKELNLDDHTFEWVTKGSSQIGGDSKIQNRIQSMTGVADGRQNPGESSPADHRQSGMPKQRNNTVNFLEIPNAGMGKADSENSGNDNQQGFNSKMVKNDSYSNINSKEELGIIKDLEQGSKPKSASEIGPSGIGATTLSNTKMKKSGSNIEIEGLMKSGGPTNGSPINKSQPVGNRSGNPGEVQYAAEPDASENYSQGMDENVSSITKKMERATLTSRYNRPKIVNLSRMLTRV